MSPQSSSRGKKIGKTRWHFLCGATSLPQARFSTLTMEPQGLPPHHDSPDMQKMQLHRDGSVAAGLMEITSQEYPAHCVSAFLHQNSLFWEISSFRELGRLLLNSLCHGTAGIHSAHVCDSGRHTAQEGPVQPLDH